MNENSSTNSTLSAARHGLTAEAISRRAYELWEKEGRPESRDLHHWLRAEEELLAEMRTQSTQHSSPGAQRPAHTDVQPLQGTRAGAANANRDARAAGKRSGSSAPFSGDRSSSSRPTQAGTRSGPSGR